jgi:hypothetical protein
MIRRISRVSGLFVGLALFLSILEARAEKRVALVIGNGSYQNTQRLANPRNDADDLAEALKRVDFAVTLEHDLDKRGMERAIAQFARDARDADAALFYYAGHGLQHQGLNYLMPTDARLDDEFNLNFEMTRLEDVLLSLGRARGVKILVLDACRRNPLVDRLAGTTRDFAATRGLARLEARYGMVVAYATQADQVAVDGSGRNSPFTAALVKQLSEPGLEIGMLFRRVAADVNRMTGGRQLPELSVSLLGEFYFVAAAAPTEGGQSAMPTPPKSVPLIATPPAVSRAALIADIKKELKRVGCYAGRIDNNWATRETRSSVVKFVKFAKLPTAPAEPENDFLDAIRGRSDRVCPQECDALEVEKDGRCVAKTCRFGFTLGDDGVCRRERNLAIKPSQPGGRDSAVKPISRAAVGRLDPQRAAGFDSCSDVYQGCMRGVTSRAARVNRDPPRESLAVCATARSSCLRSGVWNTVQYPHGRLIEGLARR